MKKFNLLIQRRSIPISNIDISRDFFKREQPYGSFRNIPTGTETYSVRFKDGTSMDIRSNNESIKSAFGFQKLKRRSKNKAKQDKSKV